MSAITNTRPRARLSAKRRRSKRASWWLLTVALLLPGCGSETTEPEHPGKAVYLRYCFACHQAGIAGAPKLGDQEAWAPRLAQGDAALLENVKRGMPPGMPPRGACPSCDDETLAVAVDYMVANLREEAAP